MAAYRRNLPQLDGTLFLTDGGMETTLIFLDGIDLPHFAAFHLLKDEAGRAALRRYYERHAAIARRNGTGFVLETATWRANPDWGATLGYDAAALAEANRRAVDLVVELRAAYESADTPMPISGCFGPRGDGYDPGAVMTPGEAEDYHGFQAAVFAGTAVDMVTAVTMTNSAEAIGVVRAAATRDLPSVVSFTVEIDGRLPTGQSLGEAIAEVDGATAAAPAYYMVNCAHPEHFRDALDGTDWVRRLRGVRANASRRSHAELDSAPDLDDGDPLELGGDYAALRRRFGWINVLGGCCGTDHRHIEAICGAVQRTPSAGPAS